MTLSRGRKREEEGEVGSGREGETDRQTERTSLSACVCVFVCVRACLLVFDFE